MKKILFTSCFLFVFMIAQAQQYPETRVYGGALLSSPKEYNTYPHLQLTETQIRTTRLDPEFYLNTPPVGDQGQTGSCVGWALGYTFLSTLFFGNPNDQWTKSNTFSPSYIYNFELFRQNYERVKPPETTLQNDLLLRISIVTKMSCDSPISVRLAIDGIKQRGDCLLKIMDSSADCHQLPNKEQDVEAAKFSLTLPKMGATVPPILAANPANVEELKYCLYTSRAPVIIGYYITPEFNTMWYYNSGIWNINSKTYLGGHCVCIVGYSDSRRMFKVQNQWGTQFGDGGYFWVTYDLVALGCFQEAYYVSR